MKEMGERALTLTLKIIIIPNVQMYIDIKKLIFFQMKKPYYIYLLFLK